MRRYDRTTVLLACTAGFFVTYFARMAISPVVPFIAEDFQVSNAAIGIALTGMWLAYGLAQYPSGIIGDRFGERQVILVAVGGTTVAAVLLTLTPLFALFSIVVIILGAMAGLHYSPATNLISRTHDNIGWAVGIHQLGPPVAGLLAPVIATWVGVRYGWRPAIATVVLVGLPTALFVLWGVRRSAPQRPDERVMERLRVGAGKTVLVRPAIVFTIVIAMLGTFVIQALLTFLPMFLVEYRAYTATVGGVGFSAFFVVRAIVQPVIGRLSDTYGRDLGVGLALCCGALGIFGLVFATSIVGVAIAIGLAGSGMAFFAVIDARFIDALGDAEQGSGFGLVRTVYTVIGAAGPAGAGIFADAFGWHVSFIILGTMLALACLAIFLNRVCSLGY